MTSIESLIYAFKQQMLLSRQAFAAMAAEAPTAKDRELCAMIPPIQDQMDQKIAEIEQLNDSIMPIVMQMSDE